VITAGAIVHPINEADAFVNLNRGDNSRPGHPPPDSTGILEPKTTGGVVIQSTAWPIGLGTPNCKGF
jgi:hypothetical protein